MTCLATHLVSIKSTYFNWSFRFFLNRVLFKQTNVFSTSKALIYNRLCKSLIAIENFIILFLNIWPLNSFSLVYLFGNVDQFSNVYKNTVDRSFNVRYRDRFFSNCFCSFIAVHPYDGLWSKTSVTVTVTVTYIKRKTSCMLRIRLATDLQISIECSYSLISDHSVTIRSFAYLTQFSIFKN